MTRPRLTFCNPFEALALLGIVEKGMRSFGWVGSNLNDAKGAASALLPPFSLVICGLSRHQNEGWRRLRSIQMLQKDQRNVRCVEEANI